MLAALLASALTSPDAFAWSPAVHRALSARALELEAGAEGAPPALREEAADFPRAAALEDLNLLRKWGRWHHYYVPSPMAWRRPSVERVALLESLLSDVRAEDDRGRAWVLAGFLAHHVQDMASPPHVVPVEHGLADAFEGYDVRPLVAAAGAEAPPALAPGAAQHALAAATLAALQEPLACDDAPVAWSDFWRAPTKRRFGRLGPLRFGRADGCEVGTAAFARARVEAAVAYTRTVVRFVLGGMGLIATPAPEDP